MLRLVQGDVGRENLVAAIAALRAVDAGYRVALMAPTELLAEQHRHNFSDWVEPLGIKVAWLSGRLKGKHAKKHWTESPGTAQLIVGTCVVSGGSGLPPARLAIIDEQHRFGVHQRLSLARKTGNSTTLTNWYSLQHRYRAFHAGHADLDCSVIDELPPGRTPVKTGLIDNQRRDEVVTCWQGNCPWKASLLGLHAHR